ncbi:hypothetical protein DB347_18595 [Opitutaceae bacterium EW11]|nr:hypothetical protein DB347_18595 [Opitutaceae bacterium EW11]
MLGPIGDALQLAWGLLYWNFRKTVFRARRDRVPCPCQTPSDSGRAWETGCEPSILLRKPARFRRVCPLLRQDAQGRWRCSVDTADVRPFWGRAAVIAAATALAVFVLGSLGAWGLLRQRGYPLGYVDVAWPGRWSEFHLAQSRVFAQRAQRALDRGDVPDAIMSLAVSFRLDPSNYALGRVLAQLTQFGQPGLADQTYSQLLQLHPDRAAETLAAWNEALLWRADFAAVETVSREGLLRDPGHTTAWLHSLIFAVRRSPNDALLRELAAGKKLDVRSVAELELRTHETPEAARAALLELPPIGASPYLEYYRPRRLLELGYPEDALALLEHSRLPMRDRIALRLDALTLLDRTSAVETEIGAILSAQSDVTTVELLSAYLVRHPNSGLLAGLFAAVSAHPLPTDAGGYRAWAGLLCAAAASGDFGRFREAGAEMKRISGTEFRALKQVEAFFRGEGASSRIESYLPAMQPLPSEVTLALLERYYQPRPPASVAKQP